MTAMDYGYVYADVVLAGIGLVRVSAAVLTHSNGRTYLGEPQITDFPALVGEVDPSTGERPVLRRLFNEEDFQTLQQVLAAVLQEHSSTPIDIIWMKRKDI